MGKAKYINSRKFSNMNKLIKKIGTDKLLHFFAGAVIGLIGLVVFNSAIGVIIPTMLAGVLKEVYDHLARWLFKKKHTPEWQDMLWTWAGGIIPLGLIFI